MQCSKGCIASIVRVLVAELTIPQAAAALGVSVDTVRRRIKAGRLRAQRKEGGAYVVKLPAPAAHPASSRVSQPPAGAQQPSARPSPNAGVAAAPPDAPHASESDERRRISDHLGDIRGLRELLEVERLHSSQLLDTVQFQRRQLEQAEGERRTLVAVIETLQEHFGIEQLQRILGEGAWSRDRAAGARTPEPPAREPTGGGR